MLISNVASALGAKLYNPTNIDLQKLDVSSLTSLSSAISGQISFYDGSRPVKELFETKASAVIVAEEKQELQAVQLVCKNPREAMVKALSLFLKKKEPSHTGHSEIAYIHPEATVDPSATLYPMAFVDKGAKIGANTVIYPHAYVGEQVTIGEHCMICPNVTLMNGCELGNHVIVYPGSVIGTEGFGFIPNGKELQKIPQIGKVIIEDNVQIGSLCSIDSATFDKTSVRKGSKLDAMVKLGHNVTVGEHTIICAQVGMSGGGTLGDHVIVAGQVGFNNNVSIASHTTIGGKTGVTHDLEKGTYHGHPVMEAKEWRRMILAQKRIPQLLKDMRRLQKELDHLKEELSTHS